MIRDDPHVSSLVVEHAIIKLNEFLVCETVDESLILMGLSSEIYS